MTIQPFFNFNPEVRWANGAGCLTCGSNTSELGREAGVQAVYLGVSDPVLGEYGLCYDCALQVALAAGCVPRTEALAVLEDARRIADGATQDDEGVLAAAAQARLDRDVVERLIGSVYATAEAAPA